MDNEKLIENLDKIQPTSDDAQTSFHDEQTSPNIIIESIDSEQIDSQNNNALISTPKDKEITDKGADFFAFLPNELIALILLFYVSRNDVSKEDIATLSLTNKQFYSLSQDYFLITSWLRPQVKYNLPKVDEPPFPALYWFYWLRSHIILSERQIAQRASIYLNEQIMLFNKDDKYQLTKDFCDATVDFWQQLTQTEQALRQTPGKANIDWLQASPLVQQATLRLLLLHQFPTWNINADLPTDEQQALIQKRQAFITCLVEKGFLPNYNNPNTRAKFASNNLILFPFLSTQDGEIWHEAMQLLYKHNAFAEIRITLSQAIMSHFNLLMKQNAIWANAYLAAKFMTVSMSEENDYGTSINHLMIAIDWLTTKLQSPLFAQYATGVGPLAFMMLEPFNNYRYDFQLKIFRDFRKISHIIVSGPKDASYLIQRFIESSGINKQAQQFIPELSILTKNMQKGEKLYQALLPYTKKNADANNKEDDFDYFHDPIFGNDYLLENDDSSEVIQAYPGQQQSNSINITKLQRNNENEVKEKPKWAWQLWKSPDVMNKNEENKFEEPHQFIRKTRSY